MSNWREQVAFHEAGHVVAALHYGVPFESVSIGDATPDGSGVASVAVESWVSVADQRERRRLASPYLGVTLAGGAAERILTGRAPRGAGQRWDGDRSEIHWYAVYLWPNAARWLLRERLKRRELQVRRMLSRRWRLVERVARALLENGTLTSEDVTTLARSRALGQIDGQISSQSDAKGPKTA